MSAEDKIPLEDLAGLLQEASRTVAPDSRWRHYKGDEYVVRGVCILEASNELAVRYSPVSEPRVEFVRVLSQWQEIVHLHGHDTVRFTKLS